MKWTVIGAFKRNFPFGTELAFQKGLERIGEQVTVIDPSFPDQKFDSNPDVTLVFKWLDPGPLRDAVKSSPGKKIVYQVDDLRFPHIKKMMIDMRDTCDHALTFDEDGAKLAKSYGYASARRMLLTADNLLYRHMPEVAKNKDIDVCFVGSLSYGANHVSRMKMIDIVRKMGVKFEVRNELFDINEICKLYNRSKVVLNHATDVGQPFGHGFGYQCRHFEVGFTKTCILSNTIDNDSTLKGVFQFRDEEEFVYWLKVLLNSKTHREIGAQALYDCINKKHLPEHRAKEMVDFVRSIE
jgi:hypothetical protein